MSTGRSRKSRPSRDAHGRPLLPPDRRGGAHPEPHIEVSLIQAGPELAERLEIGPGDTVVARRRVRSINGEPTNINDSHFRSTWSRTPRSCRRSNCRAAPIGAGRAGLPAGPRRRRDLRADADPEEVHRLGLGPGTPVAVHHGHRLHGRRATGSSAPSTSYPATVTRSCSSATSTPRPIARHLW